ncbi:platelet-activating factor acetylhydrolase isoform II [Ureibacillus xyleni]|uniref:Platelet-activating factor acetylhydrolase isoform II n=1 Tax=Ureibacillus xyleni TaxID=614648 RepID=A0A285SKG2_9BACL|nr:alpha/beta hydrolase [Ureibacillus xyleni]SOC08475.1 platelet-activating factor acetylhydrolase isoform II [Ureibacillus xyleni]
MGIVLFCIALILEVGFAIYCIVTRQHHKRGKNWSRIAVLILFLILVLSPVITWSFRWVMITIVLVLLAGLAAISLVRNKAYTKEIKNFRIILNAIFMICIFFLALVPAIIFPQYQMPEITGEYKVATKTVTYVDESRKDEFGNPNNNRSVNVEFWYPQKADDTYPLLVFSHGANGVKASNASTFKELASHGYVVCSIDHPYHSLFTVSDKGEVTTINTEYMKEVVDANKEGIYTNEEVFGLIQKWMKLRTDDMNFVIDTILQKSKTDNNLVYQLINPEKIGIFGHSMGGSASVWVGGEREDVDAVVNLDAPFFSELIFNYQQNNLEASNQTYTTPVLNIYTDDVWNQLDSNPTYAANKAENRNFVESYTTYFQGAKHLSLTDLSMISPLLSNLLQGGKADINPIKCLEKENQLILQFFDYKLKDGTDIKLEQTYVLK